MSGAQGNQARLSVSKEEQEAVEQQLKILLSDPILNQSKRYQELLKYIIKAAINGNADSLKERILGVEVFGRTPDYDTIKDPIVRVSVAGLRKRINSYYSKPQNQQQLRIVIPVGSYIPQFIGPADSLQFPVGSSILPASVATTEWNRNSGVHIELAVPSPEKSNGFRTITYVSISIAILALLVLLGQEIKMRRSAHSAISAIWSPMIQKDESLICAMGGSNTMSAGNADVARQIQTPTVGSNAELIRYDDVDPLVKVITHLQENGIRCRPSISSALRLSDLQQGPVILIGAFNNAWTLRLLEPLRFHFGNDAKSNALWIEDKTTGTRWQRNIADVNATDYAIVARYRDDLTNEPTLVLAGLGSSGTVVAGQYVTDSAYIQSLVNKVGRQALTENFEIVIETETVNGTPGTPHAVSSYFWK